MGILVMRMVFASLSFLLLVQTPIVYASEVPNWQKLSALQNVKYREFSHKPGNKPKQLHYVFIKLPTEYEQQPNAKFPTLFLLDGGVNFPLFAGYYHQLRFMQDIPPMILVGLSYGSFDWRAGNNRGHDFTLPSNEHQHTGGAKHFDRFLTDTLIPELSQQFPIDTQQLVLFGQSLGGQFALYSALYGTAPFHTVIASNPALHRTLEQFKRPLLQHKKIPEITITSAQFDDERFIQPLKQWHNYWQSCQPKLNYQFVELNGHNHLSATPASLRAGLRMMFAEAQTP